MHPTAGGSPRLFRGDRLKQARARKQLSLNQLSSSVGLAKGYLSQLENGQKSNPGLDKLQRLAAVLGVSGGYLLGESDS